MKLPSIIAAMLLTAVNANLRSPLNAFVQAKAWKTPAENLGAWPENDVIEIASKGSTGIVFNGGGARAFTASIGYLAGLHKLGLLHDVKYMTGVSGGSWTTAAYTWQPFDNNVFLGPVTDPASISLDFLATKTDPNCGRTAFAELNFVTIILKKFLTNGFNFERSWRETVQEVVMTQASIDGSKIPSLNFPEGFDKSEFLPIDLNARPFPIMGITLVTPSRDTPRQPSKAEYTMIEATPMYMGVSNQRTIDFPRSDWSALCWWCSKFDRVEIGGFVEPFAFGSDAPAVGLGSASSGLLQIIRPQVPFGLANIIGASSYVPGTVFSGLEIFRAYDYKVNYWSPSVAKPETTNMALGDGGSVSNIPVIPLIRRGVENVVVFGSFDTPLPSRAQWDPQSRDPVKAEVDRSISSLFGVFMKKDPLFEAWDERRNQIFPTADFVPLMMALQDAAASGNGAVVTMELTTIQNDWWEIPAGQKVSITWVYTVRLLNWELQLPTEVRSNLNQDFTDFTGKVTSGPFKGFPFYSTIDIHPTRSQAALLAEMCGSLVTMNAEIFRQALTKPGQDSASIA